MPALPLDEAGKYVAGAYTVFVVLLLIYVAIMAIRMQRISEQIRELAALAEAREGNGSEPAPTPETTSRQMAPRV